jgi:chemotaxis protein MotA
MSDHTATQDSLSANDTGTNSDNNVTLSYTPPRKVLDYATLLGLVFSLALIAIAIYIGQSNANFFNIPSVLIVIMGTILVTTTSYSISEIVMTWKIIGKTFFKQVQSPSRLARELLDMVVLAKKKGILALSNADAEFSQDPFLQKSAQIVTDGYTPEDLELMMGQEIDMLADRHHRAAGILKRAAEVAPAMGLIGTLVGLVQMLADLDNPSAIGPAMAVALLTTFYGAIMGTVVISPLAGKLENNSNDEIMLKSLILTAMMGIARQENPRRVEMQLNSELPPAERIRYFD